jgi:glycosyl transferase family 61
MIANSKSFVTQRPVEIISERPAPEIINTNVMVHYYHSGSYRKLIIATRRPTYFEKIVVARVHETLPCLKRPSIPISSIRNCLRYAYHTAGQMTLSLRSPIVLTTPVLDTRGAEPNNMAHLLLNVVPFCLYARSVVGPDIAFLFRNIRSRFRELLDIFSICPIYEPSKVTANVIKIRGTRGLAVYDLLGTFDCEGINFIPEVYSGMEFCSGVKFERVFLARRGPRGLVNQRETEELVSRYGYNTVYMEDYPLLDQLSIGAQTKHVVAIHGAAMSFLLMSKRIDTVIELLPPNVYHAVFPVCLSPRVLHYEQIIPEFDEVVAHRGWDFISYYKNRPFSVDLKHLESRLSEIH